MKNRHKRSKKRRALHRRIIRKARRLLFKKPKMRTALKPVTAASDKEGPSGRKRLKGLSELIALGKEKGHLTFEEVNNILPVEIVSSEEIDEILGILGEENIKLVDNEEDLAKESQEPEEDRAQEEKKEEPEKEEVVKLAHIDDPVKMYLKQMGQIPLLTRSEELEIAERIKKRRRQFQRGGIGYKTLETQGAG
ncbi:MAG: hypothetical protein NTW09_01640, partial [Candidatus Omnitrophica bacterium]|nr:hypothetical protein [Candidatus Omnitrophota bacterium]